MNRSVIFSLAVLGLAGAGCSQQAAEVKSANVSGGSRIVGGQPVTAQDAFSKSVVAIYDTQVGGLCTGTIISKNLIVTAGHCAQSPAEALKVIFGLNIQSQERIILGVESLAVNPRYAKSMAGLNKIAAALEKEEVATNPNYDPKHPSKALIKKFQDATDKFNNWGDIALLKLAGELPSGYVPAMILNNKDAIQNDSPVLLAGYGITQSKKPGSLVEFVAPTSMDVVGNVGASADDALILRKVVVNVKDRGFSESEVLLDQTQGKGACHGDSGGPAYSMVNGQLYVWGVTSRGIHDPEDSCGSYSAYTDMLDHADWIVQTAVDMGASL